MSRIFLILLALVLAVVTTAVPVNRAAKAFGNGGGSPSSQDVVAQEVSGQRGTSAPIKRCQSGAGMLSCPFQNPAMAGLDVSPEVVPVPYLEPRRSGSHGQVRACTASPSEALLRIATRSHSGPLYRRVIRVVSWRFL